MVSARDATQADLLLRRYLAPADAFVHADLPGAPVTVVKPPPARDEDGGGAGEGHAVINRADEAAGAAAGAGRQSDRAGWCGGVPPLSLVQAGAACLCRSSAWDSRHVISAWWARPENIRKVGLGVGGPRAAKTMSNPRCKPERFDRPGVRHIV